MTCAAGGALVAEHAARRIAYLVVDQPVSAGQTIAPSELGTVSIAPGPGLDAIPVSETAAVLGRYAVSGIAAGSLIIPADLTSNSPLPQHVALVGAALASNQMPIELAPAEQVLVILSGTSTLGSTTRPTGISGSPPGTGTPSPSDSPGTVLSTATVMSLSSTPMSSQGASSSSGTTLVTLEVPESLAPAVTAASAAGNVSLAVLPLPARTP